MVTLTPQTLAKARAGQEAAVAAVLTHMMPPLRRLAARAVCPGLEFDDALQEGIIGLFGAIKTYRPTGGASFETYAAVCMRNAITAARRAAGRKKNAPLNQSLPLEDAAPAPGPEELAIRREQLEAAASDIRTRLSPFERKVLAAHLAGGSYRQIARQLGCTPKAVENALVRLRRKLRGSHPTH